MAQLPYDITSADSIYDYSKKLIGKTLEQAVGKDGLDDALNKGKLGTLVEEHFFEYKPGPNRDHEPDFKEAGVELKVTGVVPKKRGAKRAGDYQAKERLVLTMINYMELVHETWEVSTFLKKCRLMLILFYLYQKELPSSQRTFVMSPILWEFPAADLEIMRKDWLTIKQKIDNSLAHELSEGDTFYLAACRKGSGGAGETLKKQPGTDILAKSRAFSLKPSYLNTIVDASWKDSVLIEDSQDAAEGIEHVAYDKFKGLAGMSVQEIGERYNYPDQTGAKSYYAALALRVLGTNKKWLPEFVKADIVMKVIRLKQNGVPEQSVSFPTFDFIETSQQDWEDSQFYEVINRKFFFVVFQYDAEDVLRFKKSMFWNMPYSDRLEAQKVWEKTAQVINSGDMLQLPKASENSVAHVRPHGRNNQDTLPLPNGGTFPKRCFWLNAKYIASQVA